MMRIAVVDDQKEERELLLGYIYKFSSEIDQKYEVLSFENAEELIQPYKAIYDIIFMDIEMGEINGINAAKSIRSVDENVVIVFITNMAKYAVEGYSVDALDYIVKPVSYEEFSIKMQRALRKVALRTDRQIVIKCEDEQRRVNISSIMYVEVLGHYLFFHTKNRVYKVRGSMKDCEYELLPYNFTRIHRAYLVNLAYVDNLKASSVVINESDLPMGRNYRDKVLQDFLSYARG